MKKINPCLWFDNNAEAAVQLYTSVFKNSSVDILTHYEEGSPLPAGSVMTVQFKLEGQTFMSLNGGPHFKFTPAISFFVTCNSEEEFESLFSKLSFGGQVLMEPGDYSFSKKFAWINDRFGLSWQFNLPYEGAPVPLQKITQFFMFTGQVHGRAEEAVRFYTSLFQNSAVNFIDQYISGDSEPEGTVKHSSFTLDGSQFMAIDSSLSHNFTFTGAVSNFVNCADQNEINWFWEKLSEGGQKSRCGWLIDKFGVYWQIIPVALGEMLNGPDKNRARKVVQAMLKMDKLDIKTLTAAFEE